MKRLILLSCVLCITIGGSATVINVPESIWFNCKNGVDSLEALVRFHKTYKGRDITIVYPTKKTIYLTISANSEAISLSQRTNFNGCRIIVKNTSKPSHILFHLTTNIAPRSIYVSKRKIDSGDFREIPELSKGTCLLIINDKMPWVDNRKGYSYGAKRSDIMLLNNGIAEGTTTTSYNTRTSDPMCRIISTDNKEKFFCNLKFERAIESTAITRMLRIEQQNNVKIENIMTETPQGHHSPTEGDQLIFVYNSTNILFNNIIIKGSYSSYNKYGYGLSLDNVWNCTFKHLMAEAQWGIFGNNNVNNINLEDCDINRFDIHCYGRDITFRRCTFHNELNSINTYNQISSVFGTIQYDNCRFLHFFPILHESSYNAYTGYELVMRNCYMELDKEHNCIIRAGKLNNEINMRQELKEKCWPNITIEGMTIKTNGVTVMYIFKPYEGNDFQGRIGNLSKINVNGFVTIPKNAALQLYESTFQLHTCNHVKRNISLPSNIRLRKMIK